MRSKIRFSRARGTAKISVEFFCFRGKGGTAQLAARGYAEVIHFETVPAAAKKRGCGIPHARETLREIPPTAARR